MTCKKTQEFLANHSVAVREGPANLVATLRTPRGAVTLESKGI